MNRQHPSSKVQFLVCFAGFLALIMGATPGSAQTTLVAGDIAIYGTNFDNPDEFAFVALADMTAGTEITFTDSGWLGAGGWRGGEGGVKWTAASAVTAGQVFNYTNPASGEWSVANDANIGTNGMLLSGSGDQVIAFQGDSASPTFIYGLNNEGAAVWQANATSSNTSALPTGLTNGTTALALTEIDNAQYTGARSGADKNAVLALVSDYLNWAGSNTVRETLNMAPFSIGGADLPPTVLSTTPSDLAAGVAVDANISVTFSEDVTVTPGSWHEILCSSSGIHSAAEDTGPVTYTLDPATDFTAGETCTVTVVATFVEDVDGTPDAMVSDYVFTFSTAAPQTVVINEVQCDPHATLGDANGDGSASTTQDEFVEIVNISGGDLDVSDWEIHDIAGLKHVFELGTIIPTNCAIVVFGGGAPQGTFGGALWQVSSQGGLGLNNSNETVFVYNELAQLVTSAAFGSETGDNQSVTLDEDITGPSFVKHSLATDSGGALFSPGTMINGSPFSGCSVPDIPPYVASTTPADGAIDAAVDGNIEITFSEAVTAAGTWFDISCVSSGAHAAVASGGAVTFTVNPDVDFTIGEVCTVTIVAAQITDQDAPLDLMAADHVFSFTTAGVQTVVINEFLFDPATDITGDANGDGVRDSSDDEFVEIYNISGGDLDVSNWTVWDGAEMRHTFLPGVIIPANCSVILFGGGAVTGTYGSSVTQTASTGSLGLGNGGDSITVFDDSAIYIAGVSYDGVTGVDQSLTLDLDISGPSYVDHSTATDSGGALFSPGTYINGDPFTGCGGAPDVAPFVSSTIPANTAVDVAIDANIDVTFSENVTLGAWYNISCATSGAHTAATTGGLLTYTLNPNTDFDNDELCTVTVVALQVSDVDAIDPPDNMVSDYIFTFTTIAAPDTAPDVLSTTPADTAVGVAVDANIDVTFTEDVVLGSWFDITCATSGGHTAVSTGGPAIYNLNPDLDFDNDELCTVTVWAAAVSDADTDDPPDAMDTDYVFSFTTVTAGGDLIFADGFETNDTSLWTTTVP